MVFVIDINFRRCQVFAQERWNALDCREEGGFLGTENFCSNSHGTVTSA